MRATGEDPQRDYVFAILIFHHPPCPRYLFLSVGQTSGRGEGRGGRPRPKRWGAITGPVPPSLSVSRLRVLNAELSSSASFEGCVGSSVARRLSELSSRGGETAPRQPAAPRGHACVRASAVPCAVRLQNTVCEPAGVRRGAGGLAPCVGLAWPWFRLGKPNRGERNRAARGWAEEGFG